MNFSDDIAIEQLKLSLVTPIQKMGLPDVVHIPINKHMGKNAVSVVKKGDVVKEGCLIAKKDGNLSTNIHSSVNGIVIAVLDEAISIEVDKKSYKNAPLENEEIVKNISFDNETIIKKIIGAGIVGMGGSGFPTHSKLELAKDRDISTLLINAIGFEKCITSDIKLTIEKAEEIIIGARIVNKLLGIQNALIVVDKNNTEVVLALTNACKRYIGVNIKTIDGRYPKGSERLFLKEISGIEVPTGKLPVDYGYMVQNVATIYAIYEAVMKDKPLYERLFTVSGEGVDNPQNYLVRVGTPISFIMKTLGIDSKDKAVLLNGRMTGSCLDNFETPISKIDSGLLFVKRFEKEEETHCFRCGRCAEKCPLRLQPFEIAKRYKREEFDKIENLRIKNCIHCGICSFVCPAKIPLLDYIKKAKEIKC